MHSIRLGTGDLHSSRLVYGCMRIAGDGSRSDGEKGKRAIRAALDAGYTHFDHADIYGAGRCEELFGQVLRETPSIRDDIIVTTKCGVRMAGTPDEGSPARYDLSAGHIGASVEGSLRRLGVERLDLLLLHRPDYLLQGDEVAEAFARLKASGKVRCFGVSNFSASQLELLRSATREDLLVNQIEINLHNIEALDNGVLDQCQRLAISPMAWCPLGGVSYSAWGNTLDADDERRIRHELERQCAAYGIDAAVIALAWLLRHPAGILPIIGSTKPPRIRSAVAALSVDYTHGDWYRLLEARRGYPVP